MNVVGKEVLMSAVSVPTSNTKYSSIIDFSRCTGEVAVLVVSTAGKITVTQQCSVDKVNWWDPVSSNGAALGMVCLNQTVTTGKYIVYTPVISKHMRFKVVEGGTGTTTVTLSLVFQE